MKTDQFPFMVIYRPGYYGREGNVYSRHRTLDAAIRATRRHNYTDEAGYRRHPAVVASNYQSRYRAGDTFWADMPPRIVYDPALERGA